jgi:N-acetylmuramoyl-L-alanine amidase
MSTIVIDPGHGGTDPIGGSDPNHATGANGLQEKAATLDLAQRVVTALNGSGNTVLMTRDTDTNLSLADRAAVARNANADAFLSIHFNAADDTTIQGTETWVHSASTDDSRLLAAVIQARAVAATGYNDRGVRSHAWGVLSMASQSPATACCLVEVSFLTDPNEAARLMTDAYKDAVAAQLAQALRDFVNHSTGLAPAQPQPVDAPNGDDDG